MTRAEAAVDILYGSTAGALIAFAFIATMQGHYIAASTELVLCMMFVGILLLRFYRRDFRGPLSEIARLNAELLFKNAEIERIRASIAAHKEERKAAFAEISDWSRARISVLEGEYPAGQIGAARKAFMIAALTSVVAHCRDLTGAAASRA